MKRALLRPAIGVVIGFSVVFALILVALGSTGVLRTAAPAWTIRITLFNRPVDLNIVGIARLATAPGVARLLDGRTLSSSIGPVHFSRDGANLIVRCAPCTLRHESLASEPVTVDSAHLAVQRNGDQLGGALTIASLEIDFTARLQPDRIDIEWILPKTPIASVYRAFATAIPEARVGRIEGRVRASGRLSLPAHRGSMAVSFEGFEVGGLGTEALQAGWFKLRCSQNESGREWMITGDGERSWLPREKLGAFLKAAVLAAEDQRFYEHGGIDLDEIGRLLATIDGRPQRGASTITQQLARTLYTGSERTMARKLRELLYATEMERTLDKERIFELYLNTVDWGPGLCGARAAARAYFNKTPARLTAIEAAWMAGILRNPHAAYRTRLGTGDPERLRAQSIVMQMREFSRADRVRWAKEPLTFARTKVESTIRSEPVARVTERPAARR